MYADNVPVKIPDRQLAFNVMFYHSRFQPVYQPGFFTYVMQPAMYVLGFGAFKLLELLDCKINFITGKERF